MPHRRMLEVASMGDDFVSCSLVKFYISVLVVYLKMRMYLNFSLSSLFKNADVS